MKKVIKKLGKSHTPRITEDNLCPEEVVSNVLDLTVALHELTRLGFSYKQITKMVEDLVDTKVITINSVVDSILKRK